MTEGINEEREKMNSIRAMADLILDTSNLTVHELRDIFMRMSRDEGGRAAMVVNLVSFGYKHGVPMDADLVFDVRCLPNPHFVDTLRPLTGRDRAVVRFMRRHASTREFIDRLTSFLTFALPQYVPGREELPHDRDRLYRRAASFGHARRGTEEVARQDQRNNRARKASGQLSR